MSKITKAVELHSCDQCGATATWMRACIACGKEHCHTCDETHGVLYSHGVYFGGSGDGYYCRECDTSLTQAGIDSKHNAYRRIKRLRDEVNAWSADFKRRSDLAEEQLKKLQ